LPTPETGCAELSGALAKALDDRLLFELDLKHSLHFAGNRVGVLGQDRGEVALVCNEGR
jgi:hypothetical protein